MDLSKNNDYCFFEINESIFCIRFVDKNKERFELEFNLEKGTSFNTFFIVDENKLIMIHPPEKIHAKLLLNLISQNLKKFGFDTLEIITGHINPNY